jgi:hypothetical protein
MNDTERLLRQAQHEIRQLRQRNEILTAQMFVVEAFHAALLGPPRGQGVSPDLTWEIERHLERQAQQQTEPSLEEACT